MDGRITMPAKSNSRHMDEINIIRNVPFFSDLTHDALKDVERAIIKKYYSKDQVVLFEEETSTYMYLVYSGKVRVVKMNEEGREQIITMHKKSDFFGEMALLDGKTAPATVVAHEDTVVGLLSKANFEQYLQTHEDIRIKIINLLCARLRDSWSMIKILSFDNAEHRVIAVLGRMRELYGVADNRGQIINVKLTHQQIANYAAVTRETVTRILKQFKDEAVIQVLDGKHILLTRTFNDKIKKIACLG